MTSRASLDNLPQLLLAAAQGAADLQATDLVALDVGDVLGITDWFLVASSSNTRQVRRVAEEVEVAVKGAGGDGPLRIEGMEDARWILLDFGMFVVHVFMTKLVPSMTSNGSGQTCQRSHLMLTGIRFPSIYNKGL